MDNTYKQLAEQLNALPNGFPPTDDGRELKLLAKLYTPEEAGLAAQLLPSLETVEEIAARTGRDTEELRQQLKAMSRRGLVETGRKDGVLGFKLLPFVVGIYEMQVGTMDVELARLFEDYFQQFSQVLRVKPQVHRIIPVFETQWRSVLLRARRRLSMPCNLGACWTAFVENKKRFLARHVTIRSIFAWS
jgi:electron transport complex protein RnfB